MEQVAQERHRASVARREQAMASKREQAAAANVKAGRVVDYAPPRATPFHCECGAKFITRTKLGKHTWDKHDRPPTATERTATTAEVAA